MNLVGKILTGLIALFSIVFMALILAVYAAHTNWRDQAKKAEQERDQLVSKNKELQANLNDLDTTFKVEKKGLENAAAAAHEWVKVLLARNDSQQKALDGLNAKLSADLNTLTATQNNQKDLYAQVNGDKDKGIEGLRNQVQKAQQDRDTTFDKFKALLTQFQQHQSVLAMLKARQTTLLADLRRYRDIILMNNMSPNVQEHTPDVNGRVTAVSATGLVEIDIGRDAGLRPGQQLHVYRATGLPYLGKVEVVQTEPQRAVCKILRDFQKGPILRDDHVASNLRLQ